MAETGKITRRKFLKRTAAAGAAFAMPAIVPASVFGANAPSNRITVGMIGLGRQVIYTNLRSFLSAPDCQVVALCDVDRWRLNITENRTSAWGGGIKPERDKFCK